MPVFVLPCRGLRVRVGMHSGIHNIEDAELNPTTNRVTYSGQPLVVAKATADCAAGGQVSCPCARMHIWGARKALQLV